VKTARQFPCGSQIPNRSPWLCSAKLKVPALLPQLENVIAAWMSPAYIAYVVLYLYSNYEVATGNDRNSVGRLPFWKTWNCPSGDPPHRGGEVENPSRPVAEERLPNCAMG
jgi:hypothetical protein